MFIVKTIAATITVVITLFAIMIGFALSSQEGRNQISCVIGGGTYVAVLEVCDNDDIADTFYNF